MADVIFELGCEELPASFVERSLAQLAAGISAGLTQARIEFGAVESYATPRRLIVGVHDVKDRQPDQTKEVRGPGVKAAFDAQGNPTKALEGFLRSQGGSMDQVRQEGDYTWLTVFEPGQPTIALLPNLIGEAVKAMTFDKTMRWGTSRMRFARPIRWMTCLFGSDVIPVEIEGVKADRYSRGHRFDFPEQFEVTSLSQLLSELRKRNVEPDAIARRNKILTESSSVANSAGGVPDLIQDLIEENSYLTEWPTAHVGRFAEGYLELPEQVVVTAMAKHERFLPIRTEEGKLMNAFVSIRNAGDEATVRAGNEWVLNARLNDAKFFYDEDRRLSLDEFLAKTKRMAFQDKLGTVRQRADRLSELCARIARDLKIDESLARKAGLYAKADLATGLVGELASLQGQVGGTYAAREGFPPEVCAAIQGHYDLSAIEAPTTLAEKLRLTLVLADAIDKIVGFMGVGHSPSGSSDPFGLRRAATTVILVSLAWDGIGDLAPWLEASTILYGQQAIDLPVAISPVLADVLASRYDALFEELPHDVRRSVIAVGNLENPQLVKFRFDVASQIKADSELVETLSRPINLAKSVVQKGGAIDPQVRGNLDSAEGDALSSLVDAATATVSAELGTNGTAVLGALQSVKSATHTFFESTMVMAEDEAVRAARLGLVARIRDLVGSVCDLTHLA